MMKIYVGNLNFRTSEDGVREAFERFGTVDRVSIVLDRETGRSRGFAFVEMGDDAAAQSAVDALDGSELDGRTLTVNPARNQERPSSGGRGEY